MSAVFSYQPHKLTEALQKIRLQHAKPEPTDYSQGTEEMDQLIRRLQSVSDGMVRASALAMSDREVHMLAGYLPYNYYELEEGRLFEMLGYRLDSETCNILYSQWQESFNNHECNDFIRQLTTSNDAFRALLAERHIDEEVFLQILDSRNIPLSFDELLIGRHYTSGEDFENRLQYYGVTEQSLLDVECKRALLTFCGKADYFNCSEQNLLDIIQTYDMYMLRKFLLNFMSKMSLAELQMYPDLAAYMRSVTGHRRSRTFQAFFRDADSETIQQYQDWINIYKINAYFENDDRSRFWKQYRYMNVVRYPVSNTVVMEFEDHVAVEFLGERKGTIYLCDKEVFKENFYQYLDEMDNENLRSYFKIHKDLCLEYRNHSGRWQSHMGNVIAKRGIAESVRI